MHKQERANVIQVVRQRKKADWVYKGERQVRSFHYMSFRFFAVRVYEVRTHSLSASVCSIVPCLISYAEIVTVSQSGSKCNTQASGTNVSSQISVRLLLIGRLYEKS